MPSGWLAVAAAIDERLYGPLPGDVVNSNGKYLLERPTTPIHSPEHDSKFSQQLHERLESLVYIQNLRSHKYGSNVAEEYPISHTPSEIKSAWENEQAAFDKFLDDLPPTPSDDGTPMSTMSGSTCVSYKNFPQASISNKFEMYESTTTFTLRPTTQQRLSHLDKSNNCEAFAKSLPTLFEDQSSPLSSQLRKRRHSDAENDFPLEQEHQQKRRIAAPSLHRLISVG